MSAKKDPLWECVNAAVAELKRLKIVNVTSGYTRMTDGPDSYTVIISVVRDPKP